MGHAREHLLNAARCVALISFTLLSHLSAVAQGVAPSVPASPQACVVHEKQHFRLSPVVAGDSPFSYQWFLNGSALPSETNFAIFFRSVETNNAGTYSLVVSNAFGSTTASVATLDVQPFRHNKLIGWPGTVMSSDYPAHHYYLSFDDIEDVVNIFSGAQNNFAVLKDGSVLSWPNDYFFPPIPLTNITAVAAGGPPINQKLAYGLTTDGKVIAWNQETNYVLNISDAVGLWTRPDLTGVLLLKANGTLTIWENSQFQPVVGLSNIVEATPVTGGIVGLRNDGVVVASGANLPVGLTNISSITAAGSATFAVTADGSVLEWNDSGYTTIPVGLTNVIAVSAYSENSVAALQSDGSIVAWGSDVAQSPPQLTNAVAIRVGPADLALVAVEKDTNAIEITSQIYNENVLVGGSKTVYVQAQSQTPVHYQWSFHGTNIPGATDSVLALHSARIEDAGTYSLLMSNDYGATLTTDVGVHVIPTNLYPVQLGISSAYSFVPPGLSNVVGVAASAVTSTALKADGTVVQWGLLPSTYPDAYPPANATNLVAVAAAAHNSFDYNYGLRKDGTVVSWGSPAGRPFLLGGMQPPAGLKHVTEIHTSGDFSLALKSDGTVVSWGFSPLDTSSLSNIVKIKPGPYYNDLNCAAFLDKQGRPFVIGNFPPPPDGLSNLVDISLYPNDGWLPAQGTALQADGTTICWGDCYFTPPPNIVQLFPLMALDDSGTLFQWDRYTSTTAVLASNVYTMAYSPEVYLLLTTKRQIPSLDVLLNETNVVVSWKSSSTCILESKSDLGAAPWLPVDDGSKSYMLETPGVSIEFPASSRRFFRLRVLE